MVDNKPWLIFSCTMGSHGPTYYERYTAEDRTFTPTCDRIPAGSAR